MQNAWFVDDDDDDYWKIASRHNKFYMGEDCEHVYCLLNEISCTAKYQGGDDMDTSCVVK